MAPADWGGAKEAEEVKESRTVCRGSLSLAENLVENYLLMALADWGGAKEAEVVKGSRPLVSIPLAIVILLAILSLAAHSPTLLMTPRYLSTGGCGLSATIYYLSSRGLKAVHGLARARSLTHSQAEEVKESRPLASIPLEIATLLTILDSAAHVSSPALLMTPGYPVRAWGCPCTCAVPPTQWHALSARSATNLSSPGLVAVHLAAVDQALPALSATNLSSPGLAVVQLAAVQLTTVQLAVVQWAAVQLTMVQLTTVQLATVQLAAVHLAAVDQVLSALSALLSPDLVAVHGPARVRLLTPPHPMGPPVSATQLSHSL
jgi:hypothetical protein